jgi:septal ring factor EnvC (AmiA/AmiB activator)
MKTLIEQAITYGKNKIYYLLFFGGALSCYVLYVPHYKTQLKTNSLTLAKTLSAFAALNKTLNEELNKNSKLANKINNLNLQNQQLLTDLDNSTERCTLECNQQLSTCSKKIEQVKLQCIRRRKKK